VKLRVECLILQADNGRVNRRMGMESGRIGCPSGGSAKDAEQACSFGRMGELRRTYICSGNVISDVMNVEDDEVKRNSGRSTKPNV
jgi:hypothetical protein